MLIESGIGLLNPTTANDDSDSVNSTNSRYKTTIKGGKCDTKEGYVFRKKLNPRYETYLQKTKERPRQLMHPKFLSHNHFEKVGLACYQKSGSTLLRKYRGINSQ